VKQGLLEPEEFPAQPTPCSPLKVDWAKTKVRSEGGYSARVFFNLHGREPQGTLPAADYEAFQDEMKARFEALTNDRNRPLDSLVFKPREVYRQVRGVDAGPLARRGDGEDTPGKPRLRRGKAPPRPAGRPRIPLTPPLVPIAPAGAPSLPDERQQPCPNKGKRPDPIQVDPGAAKDRQPELLVHQQRHHARYKQEPERVHPNHR
jgi:hypothetical protein